MKQSLYDEIFKRILEAPVLMDQLRKSLVNRDLAIEIDGQRFQLMRRHPTNEDKELDILKEQRAGLRKALKALVSAVDDLEKDDWVKEILNEAKQSLREN